MRPVRIVYTGVSPLRLVLIVGLGVLLVLSACANAVVESLEPHPTPPTSCSEPHEVEGVFKEPWCKGREA